MAHQPVPHPPDAWSLDRLPVGETALAVAQFGAGDPLILLHGIGSRGVSWLPVISSLATRFRVIVPDLRGHGASDQPSTGYLLDHHAADLAGLIDALHLADVRILGHSLGGMVALEWARTAAVPAVAIALEDVPMRRTANPQERFAEWVALASMSLDEATAHFREQHPDWTEDDCRRRARSITGTALAVFTELRDFFAAEPPGSRIGRYSGLSTPTLLVYGDVDSGGMVPASDAEAFAAALPCSRVHRIPNGTHHLHRDQTEAFLAAVIPFLEGNEGYA